MGGRVEVVGSCAGSESIPREQSLSPRMFGSIMMGEKSSLGAQTSSSEVFWKVCRSSGRSDKVVQKLRRMGIDS